MQVRLALHRLWGVACQISTILANAIGVLVSADAEVAAGPDFCARVHSAADSALASPASTPHRRHHGFRRRSYGDGLNGPSGFEIAPDGRIFILERSGKIKIVKNGQLLPTPFADLPSEDTGDRGLIGIAFDPDFGVSNHYVYFYYTGHDLLNHLVRFSAAEDVGTDGPFELFRTSSPSQLLHVGGSIRFGPDGKLYFAVGDNGYGANAQDLEQPARQDPADQQGRLDPPRQPVRRPARQARRRSGPTASATRGASSSTARPGSSTAATSATSAGRRSTTSSRAATTAGR